MRLVLCASITGLSQSINIPRLDPRLVALLGSFSGGGFDSVVRRIPVLSFLAVMFYHCSGVVGPISRHFKAWGPVNCNVIINFFFF